MFEAIILAGGLGTRLRRVIQDVPKPMADINGKPFLYYQIQYLKKNNVHKIVLAVSYKKEVILKYFGRKFEGIPIEYSIEEQPLGTGGGIKQAFYSIDSNDALILNGDTYFPIDIKDFKLFHESKEADISIALKYFENVDRYGTIKLNEASRVEKFIEKGKMRSGFINGGIYFIKKSSFVEYASKLGNSFSLEKDILEKCELKIYAKSYENYFIDIGIPEDYEKFKKEIHIQLKGY